MQLLSAVAQLPQQPCYIAAGFVRNLVWDHLHQLPATTLNDVDVIYFDRNSREPHTQHSLQQQLEQAVGGVNWQVKNQALMHQRNSDPAYSSLLDAISYWPEKETAIAVRINIEAELELISPFGYDSLLAGCISYNPKRCQTVFQQRVQNKGWLQQWPQLKIVKQSQATM